VWVAVLAGLVAFARSVSWRDTIAAMRGASLTTLVAAAVVNLLSLVIKAVRWWVFLRPVGVGLRLATRATFAGAALNNLLVANSGEAARVMLVARTANVASASILATLALERLFEAVGYVMMLALAATVLPLPSYLEAMRPMAIVVLIATGVVLVFAVRSRAGVLPIAAPGDGVVERVLAYVGRVMHTLRGVSTAPRFAAALLLSIAAWLLQVATYHLTAVAAHFPISVGQTVAALLAVNVGFAVRTTPGGVGLFQVLYAVTLASLGFDKNTAIGVALLIQAQQLIPVTILGLLAAPEMISGKRPLTPGSN
jgi:uncharacterized protein (TIRG00374 family)